MINKIMNILDRGEFFCINGIMTSPGLNSLKNVNSTIYKIRGWSNTLDNTTIVEGLILQRGVYEVIYHAEFALYEISLINNLQDSINTARAELRNTIATQAFLSNTLNEYDGEPKELIDDCIREELITEEDMDKGSIDMPPPNMVCNISHEQSFVIHMKNEQPVLNEILGYIMDGCEGTINREDRPFICRINYSTKVIDKKFDAYSILDSTIVFGGILIAGMVSYYGDDHMLLSDKNPSMSYISKDSNDLMDIVVDGLYAMIHFIQKITSSDIHVTVNMQNKEDDIYV